MARTKGLASFSGNFEPQIAAPLDARNVVGSVSDLTSTSVWQAHDGGTYLYDGMVVCVTNDTNPKNNGLYYLKDKTNYTNIESWVKIGTDEAEILDQTNNLVRNGSFVMGLSYWTHGLTQTTEVIDAPVGVQCRSGKVCSTIIPAMGQGFLEAVIVMETVKDYSRILVRFSIQSNGEVSSGTAQIIDSLNTVLQQWTFTQGDQREFISIVDISSANGGVRFRITQSSGGNESYLLLYDVQVLPFLPLVETYTNTEPSTAGAAGIPAGSTFNNMSFTEFMEAFFYPELFGTLTPPSSNFTSSIPNGTLREIGETISSIEFTATFSRGSINPQYQSASPYRSGPPNTYYYTGTGLPSSVSKTDLSDTQIITDYVVVSGVQSWTNYVAYDAGVQPKGSKGTPFDSPLPAGNTTTKTTSIVGVYPWFATTVNITTLTKQALALHTASYYQANMVAETDTDKQTAEFPTAFNSITGVQFYNTISGQWEWMGGSKSASLTFWTITDTQRNINGNMVDYKLYRHNGSKVGARQLRFYTT